MNQKECVIEALASLGGMTTLVDLYHKTDVSTWGSKTPFASIRKNFIRSELGFGDFMILEMKF